MNPDLHAFRLAEIRYTMRSDQLDAQCEMWRDMAQLVARSVALIARDYSRCLPSRHRDGPPVEVLDALAAQGIKAGEAASVTRSRSAHRARPAGCSMSVRRAALVGCAAADAPPSHARTRHHRSEVSHE